MNTDIFSINLTSEFILTSTIIIGLTISGSIIYYYLNIPSITEDNGERENLKALAKEPSVASDADTIISTDSASAKTVADQIALGTSPISSPVDTNNSSNLSSSAEVLKDPLSVTTKFTSTSASASAISSN